MISVALTAKSFGKHPILSNIAFDVAPGETLAILGPSGIGKTTLLHAIAGTDRAFEGHIKRPDRMSIVFQEPTLLLWRSVLQNILIAREDVTEAEAVKMLQRVGLGGKAQMFPGQLSLGQQRRLSLARAFVGRPQGLIMDEPFASLDPETADDMLSLTQALINDTRPATIFVTHARAEADRLADRILTLGGSPATLVPQQE